MDSKGQKNLDKESLGRIFMTSLTIGLFSVLTLVTQIAIPVSLILLLIWVYNIKKNSETHVKQLNKIIQLLEKDREQI